MWTIVMKNTVRDGTEYCKHRILIANIMFFLDIRFSLEFVKGSYVLCVMCVNWMSAKREVSDSDRRRSLI